MLDRVSWRWAERRLQRHVPAASLDPVLGDLAEDFADARQRCGEGRAALWLLRETAAVTSAYRQRSQQPRTVSMDYSAEARLAIRRLRKRPAAALVSVITLASAIGVAAVTWTLLSAVILHPLPVADSSSLVVVESRPPKAALNTAAPWQLYPDVLAIDAANIFAATTAGASLSALTATNGIEEVRPIYFASHDFFGTLGVPIRVGRAFSPDDDRRGAPLAAVISDRFWRSQFGGRLDAIGKVFTAAAKPVTIVGIAPPAFRGVSLAAAPDFYLPLNTIGDVGSRSMNFFAEPVEVHGSSPSRFFTVFGRLKAGQTSLEATLQLQEMAGTASHQETMSLLPIDETALPAAARPRIVDFARLLTATVALLLLIGGATVGLLLLIRTEARRDEFAMCLALGATHRRLATGVVLEGLVLAIAGVALAVPLSALLFRSLDAFQLPGNVKLEWLSLSVDWHVVIAAVACASGTVMLMAAVAGVFGVLADTTYALRARAGATPVVSRRRTRSLLVVGQVAVTLVLLAGATMFARSLVASLSLNPGFNTAQLVTGNLSLFSYGYTPERTSQLVDDLRARLTHHPAVESLAFLQSAGSMRGRLTIDGVPRPVPSTVDYTVVDDRYFPTMGMRVTRGRNFSSDDHVGVPLVIIVSESFGRFLADGGDPIGHRVTEISGRKGEPMAIATVVGVVPDVITDVSTLQPFAVYYALAQRAASPSRRFIIRAAGPPMKAAAAAAAAIREIDPRVNPGALTTMEQNIGQQMGPQRFGALVLGVLGATAALLSILGAYVLSESMASIRQREMAIRASLGANRASLSGHLIWQTLRLVGLGLIAGFGLVWIGASTIRSLLFQVQPFDPASLLAVATLIVITAFAVSARPALIAARADLAQLLRED